MSSNNSSNNNTSGGIGFCGLLAIVFIVLKLTHFIDWSWLWVLAPLWLPIVIVIAIVVIAVIIKSILRKRRRKKAIEWLDKLRHGEDK